MAFSSQVFKAPSLTSRPKLSKTKVSSSVFRGGSSSAIKIPKGMGYSGLGSRVDPKYLAKEVTPINQTLVETNNILVEIQKQLAFDYAMKIAEEKELIKSAKAAESRRKFAAKEKSVEAVKKIGGAIGGTIGKIAAPVKGIFDKIKEFFGLILTGIVTNVAFTWLAEEKNRKWLGDVFNFIGTTIPYLLAGFLGFKLIKWGTRLFRIGRFLWRLPGKILRVFGLRSAASATSSSGGGGLFRNAVGQRRGLTLGKATQSRVVPGRFNVAGGAIRENVDVITREKNLFNRTLQRMEVSGKMFGRNFLKVIGAGPGKKTLVKSLLKFARPILKRIPIVGALIDFALSVAMGENIGRAAFGAIGAALLGAIGTFLGGPIGTFSRGGTVPGRGSGNVDSVRAMLAPGEEVIRTASAMLFRPLLKDINDNAGRLWTAFSMGINKLMMVSKYQRDVQKEFSKSIEDQDSYLRNQKTKNLIGTGGGFGSRSSARITPRAPKVTNINISPQSGGGMTVLPMVLLHKNQNHHKFHKCRVLPLKHQIFHLQIQEIHL